MHSRGAMQDRPYICQWLRLIASSVCIQQRLHDNRFHTIGHDRIRTSNDRA